MPDKLNDKKRAKLAIITLLTLSILILISAIKTHQEIRKKAKEAEKSEKSVYLTFEDEKTIPLSTNTEKETKISLDHNRLTIRFAKGVLDAEKAKSQAIHAVKLPVEEENILRLSLKLQQKSTLKDKEPPISFSEKIKDKSLGFYTIEYSLAGLEEEYAPSSLKFTWLNPQTKEWEVLPTTYDRKNYRVFTKVSHLSEFGLKGQKAQVFSPTIQNWETSLYTGSSTFSYQIEMLPGKGGLVSPLTITYNSNRLNSLSPENKGSWLGPGWDLTLPEIRFDKWTEDRHTTTDCRKYKGTRKRGPQYSLILGGAQDQLVWIDDVYRSPSDADNHIVPLYSKYITKHSNLPIRAYYGSYQGNDHFPANSCYQDTGRNFIVTKWVVRDKSGKEYTFDADKNDSAADRKIKDTLAPSRYMVTRIEDLSRNMIVFEYQKEVYKDHIISVYPKTIKYNFQNSTAANVIEFTISAKRYPPQFEEEDDFDYQEINFERKKLDKITVYSDFARGTIYRTYKFNYQAYTYTQGIDQSSGTPLTQGYDVLGTVEKYAGDEAKSHQFVSSEFQYEMRRVGLNYIFLTDNSYHSAWVGPCQRPYPRNAGGQSMTWSELADKVETGKSICKNQREKLKKAGFTQCRGSNFVGKEGPNNPQDGCPALSSQPSFYYRTIPVDEFNTTKESGYVLVWEKAQAPFISKIENGYGGEIDFTYQTYLNTHYKQALNRNVVVKREMFDTNDPPEKKIVTEYIYEPSPAGDEVKPNKGGGFGRVTVKDKATGMLTTTFFYPLAPKDINVNNLDNGIDPEKNPYFGATLRKVVHRIEGETDHIYSDQFFTYSFVPAQNPSIGLLFPDGSSDELVDNLLTEGVGKTVTMVVDSFTPKDQNYVTVPLNRDKPQYIDQNTRDNKFLHTQKKTWYDRLGYPYKTAEYALVSGFGNIEEGSNIKNPREITSNNKDWWFGDNAKLFTYGLPMHPFLFLRQPIVKDPPATGSPTDDPSLINITYSKYLRGDNASEYLDNNLTGLVEESFISDKNKGINQISDEDKWQWTIYKYDEDNILRGLVTSVTQKTSKQSNEWQAGPNEITIQTSYYPNGNVKDQIDAKGNKTTTIYYSTGPYADILPYKKINRVKNESGEFILEAVTTVAYDPKTWLPIEETDPNGIVSRIEYDCLGRLQNVYKPDPETKGVTSSKPSVSYYYFDYQDEGCGQGGSGLANAPASASMRTKTRVSSNDNQDHYLYSDQVYDGLGRIRQTQILNTKISGEEKSVINEVEYDNRGLKIKEHVPRIADPITPTNPPSFLSIPYRRFSSFSYDELGRVTEATDPLGNKTKTEYQGLTTVVTDPNNVALEEQTPATKAAGNLLQTGIDKLKRTLGFNSSSSQLTLQPTQVITEVNGFGRTVKTIITNLPSSENSQYGLMSKNQYHPVLGTKVATTIFKCSSTTCAENNSYEKLSENKIYYDQMGRKWKTEDSDLGVWKFSYDENGNLITQVDAKNQSINFYYDSLNRLVKKEYPGNPRLTLPSARNFVRFVYDKDANDQGNITAASSISAIGKLVRIWDPTGTTVYRYDARGRKIWEKKKLDKTITHTGKDEEAVIEYDYYDSDSLKASVLPNGERIENKLDSTGQLVGITVKRESKEYDILQDQQYNQFGDINKSILGNSLQVVKKYNINRWLKSVCVAKDCEKGEKKLLDYQYAERDKVGNLISLQNAPSGLSLTFDYDNLYQLTGVSGTVTKKPYAASYEYSPLGNMLKKIEGESTVRMEYNDPNHLHAPKKVNGFTYEYDANGNLLSDKERNYVWDYDNKPLTITLGNGSLIEFAYDGKGNRILKKTPETTTLYFGPVERVFDKSGNLLEEKTYYSAGSATALKIVKDNQSEKLYYLHPDHLGSTVLITDERGKKISSYIYHPYGNQTGNKPSQDKVTDVLYTGQKKDTSTGLYFYNARYYNPQTAHFISADEAQGPNRYAYVGNNPVMKNDPSGNVVEGSGGLGSMTCESITCWQNYNVPGSFMTPEESFSRLLEGSAFSGAIIVGSAVGTEALPLAAPLVEQASISVYTLFDIYIASRIPPALNKALELIGIATDVYTCATDKIACGEVLSSPIPVQIENSLGKGFYSSVTISPEGGVAMKIFNHPFTEYGDPTELYHQISMLKELEPYGIFPRLERVVRDDSNMTIGYAMERIKGMPLYEYLGKGWSPYYILDDAREKLRILHQLGYFHGDLHPGNIMVEFVTDHTGSEIPSGVRFIDPFSYLRYGKNIPRESDELIEMLLNVSNPLRTPAPF